MKKITLKEFESLYMQPKEEWDFNKFKIICVKCSSENVEFAGQTAVGNGCYGDVDFEHKIIVKCHDCGNAQCIKATGCGNGSCC